MRQDHAEPEQDVIYAQETVPVAPKKEIIITSLPQLPSSQIDKDSIDEVVDALKEITVKEDVTARDFDIETSSGKDQVIGEDSLLDLVEELEQQQVRHSNVSKFSLPNSEM